MRGPKVEVVGRLWVAQEICSLLRVKEGRRCGGCWSDRRQTEFDTKDQGWRDGSQWNPGPKGRWSGPAAGNGTGETNKYGGTGYQGGRGNWQTQGAGGTDRHRGQGGLTDTGGRGD